MLVIPDEIFIQAAFHFIIVIIIYAHWIDRALCRQTYTSLNLSESSWHYYGCSYVIRLLLIILLFLLLQLLITIISMLFSFCINFLFIPFPAACAAVLLTMIRIRTMHAIVLFIFFFFSLYPLQKKSTKMCIFFFFANKKTNIHHHHYHHHLHNHHCRRHE